MKKKSSISQFLAFISRISSRLFQPEKQNKKQVNMSAGLGVKASAVRAYNLINENARREYLDRVFSIIEDGLLESKYYNLGVSQWLNIQNRTPKIVFISWERGLWGSNTDGGTFMTPYKHPDQAILDTSFDNDIIFVILDAPRTLAVTPQTPMGTGSLCVYDIKGNRPFGVGGAGKNPAFNNINANYYSIIFYYAKRTTSFMYFSSYGHRYNFSSILRPVEVNVSQSFFDYHPGGATIPIAYAFSGTRDTISPIHRLSHKLTQAIPNGGYFVIGTNFFTVPTSNYISECRFEELYFYENPSVPYTLTFRNCTITEQLRVSAGNLLSDFTNVTMSLYNCTIASLNNTTIDELLAFLNEYDFWYNGIHYTSGLDLQMLDNRYFNRNVVDDSSVAYAAVPGDIGTYRRFTNNAGVTLTVNAGSLETNGDTIIFDYIGTGTLTVAPGAGVTLHVNENKQLISDGQYSTIIIKKVAASTYRVYGELAPV